MKSSILLLVAFLYLGAAYADIVTELAAHAKDCTSKHNISEEQLNNMRSITNKNEIQTSDDLYLFSKCYVGKTGIVSNNELDFERLVTVSIAEGFKESLIRGNADRCKTFFTGIDTGAKSWEMFLCFHQK